MEQKQDIQKDEPTKKPNETGTGSLGLAVGLSLGILFGVAFDDMGLGMMMGVALGLCWAPAIEMLRKDKKRKEHEDEHEKQ